MLGFVSRIVGERGTGPDDADTGGSDDADAVDGRDDPPPTRLYECPDCSSVYLSDELSTCRSCNTAVEAVPSEHDLGYGSERSR